MHTFYCSIIKTNRQNHLIQKEYKLQKVIPHQTKRLTIVWAPATLFTAFFKTLRDKNDVNLWTHFWQLQTMIDLWCSICSVTWTQTLCTCYVGGLPCIMFFSCASWNDRVGPGWVLLFTAKAWHCRSSSDIPRFVHCRRSKERFCRDH